MRREAEAPADGLGILPPEMDPSPEFECQQAEGPMGTAPEIAQDARDRGPVEADFLLEETAAKPLALGEGGEIFRERQGKAHLRAVDVAARQLPRGDLFEHPFVGPPPGLVGGGQCQREMDEVRIEEGLAALHRGPHGRAVESPQQRRQELRKVEDRAGEHRPIGRIGDEAVRFLGAPGEALAQAPIERHDRSRQRFAEAVGGDRQPFHAIGEKREGIPELGRQPGEKGGDPGEPAPPSVAPGIAAEEFVRPLAGEQHDHPLAAGPFGDAKVGDGIGMGDRVILEPGDMGEARAEGFRAERERYERNAAMTRHRLGIGSFVVLGIPFDRDVEGGEIALMARREQAYET